MYIHIHIYLYLSIYLYICIYIYLSIYLYMHESPYRGVEEVFGGRAHLILPPRRICRS